MTPLLRKISFKNGCFSLPLGDNIIIIFFLVLNQPRKLKRQAQWCYQKYYVKILKKKEVYPQAFVAECMGGTSFSWDQRQNRKGIFQFLPNIKGVFLLQNECKCNIPQIAAIAAFIANSSEYDLVLLQDLWMRPDHETIRAALPKVIHNKLIIVPQEK